MQIDSLAANQPPTSGWQRFQPWLNLLGLGLVMLVAMASFGFGQSLIWLTTNTLEIATSLSFMLGVTLLPGWAVIRWFSPSGLFDRLERWALSWSMGIALPPILLQLADLVGLPINRWLVFGYGGLALLAAIWPKKSSTWPDRLTELKQLRPSSHAWLLIGLTGVIVLQRLLVVRDLAVAQWGDSYHHSMITQLLLDHGGLFETWHPYADLITFSYHYGFHANSAFLAWWGQLSATSAVLYMGQIINIAVGPLAYLLTRRLSGNQAAGIIALGFTCFYNTMPSFYVNWGRFTQLTGQVILVGVIVAWLALLDYKAFNWQLVGLAVMLTTGLVLTHYLVTIFAVIILMLVVLALLAQHPRFDYAKQVLWRGGAVGLISAVLAAPWLYTIVQSKLTAIARNYVTGYSQSYASSVATLVAIVPFYIKAPLMILIGLGLWLACAQRNWRMLWLAIWSLGLELIAVPYVLNLPLSGIITGFAVAIMLYLPLIPLAAYPLGWLYQRWQAWPWLRSISMVLLLLTIAWSTPWQSTLATDQYRMFFAGDQQALDWIEQATAADAKFLINGIMSYGDALVVGEDGGVWIPLLTKRQTTIPPLTYGSEKASDPKFDYNVYLLYEALRTTPLASAEGRQLLQTQGIDYIYSGVRLSQNNPKFQQDIQALRYLPEQFPIVYERDGVVIFAVKAQQ